MLWETETNDVPNGLVDRQLQFEVKDVLPRRIPEESRELIPPPRPKLNPNPRHIEPISTIGLRVYPRTDVFDERIAISRTTLDNQSLVVRTVDEARQPVLAG